MKKYRKAISIENFLFITVLAFCILFISVLPLGHDLHFHLYRVGAMAEELERTSFSIPIRMLSASYNNYGYGAPLFYGDLLLYIPAILVVFGISEVMAYKLLMIMIFLLTIAAMYWQIYRSSKTKDFALLAAVFYGFSSYCLLDLCIRMAIGEACACIFLPFVFCSFYNILYHTPCSLKRDWLYLVVGMTGLILSHALTAVFTTAILGIWALLEIRKVTKKEALSQIIFAAFVTLGLTASFVFPFIEAVRVQRYQVPTNNEYQIQEFAKHALDVIDFFVPYDIKKGLKILLQADWNTEIWHPGAVGIFLLAIMALIAATAKKQKNKVLTVGFGIALLIYVGMFIRPLVAYLGKFLSFMQFGWRLLIFCTFVFSVYGAYLLHKFFSRRWQTIYILIAILVACYTIAPRYIYQMYLNYKGMEYIETVNPEYYDHYVMEYSPNSGDNLYLPYGVNINLYKDRGEIVECSHEDVGVVLTRENEKCIITVRNNFYDDTKLELPLYYYKGYQAVDKITGSVLDISSSEAKLVEISLGGMQEADVVVWYNGTTVQKISDWVSGLTLLAVFLLQIAAKVRKEDCKRKQKMLR